jgi:hypothetical protein
MTKKEIQDRVRTIRVANGELLMSFCDIAVACSPRLRKLPSDKAERLRSMMVADISRCGMYLENFCTRFERLSR